MLASLSYLKVRQGTILRPRATAHSKFKSHCFHKHQPEAFTWLIRKWNFKKVERGDQTLGWIDSPWLCYDLYHVTWLPFHSSAVPEFPLPLDQADLMTCFGQWKMGRWCCVSSEAQTAVHTRSLSWSPIALTGSKTNLLEMREHLERSLPSQPSPSIPPECLPQPPPAKPQLITETCLQR